MLPKLTVLLFDPSILALIIIVKQKYSSFSSFFPLIMDFY